MKDSLIDALVKDSLELGTQFDGDELKSLKSNSRAVVFEAGEYIYKQYEIGSHWLFIVDGITASHQTHIDGRWSIARFFERGQFCGNLTSTWSQTYANDDLIAATKTSGLEIDHSFFQHQYLFGTNLGQYLRQKVIQTLCFDKEIIVLKTLSDLETKYRFLEEQQPNVLKYVMKKEIAAFLGVTPQGLSRFIRNRGT